MIHDVSIPQTIKIGGFTYTIDYSKDAIDRLEETKDYGHCVHTKKIIRISTKYSEQENSNTFLHEFIEAINEVWCNRHLVHDDINNLTNGLHQILEQLEIKFVQTKE